MNIYANTTYHRDRYVRTTWWETVTPAMVRHSIIYGGPMRTAGQKIKRTAVRTVHERVRTDSQGKVIEIETLGMT